MKRTACALRYQQAFAKNEALFLPKKVPYAHTHAWHLYTPLINIDALTIDRDGFMQQLKERNIGSGLHYSAVHEFSVNQKKYGWKPLDFPEAHFVSERILSLPLFPDMVNQDLDDTVEAVMDICKKFKR
jgi:dTDP-4-amino-4,6-dideoxygalactose transaminase